MAILSAKWMAVVLVTGLTVACGEEVTPNVVPPGDDKSVKTQLLETGSTLVQTDAPVDALDIYLVGFHPLKEEPSHQMEAHHFCRQMNEHFAQCALFDGNTADANLNGVEYIISEELFEKLPEQEKPYWHPHNYEILSGQLQAPGIPPVAEMELMRGKLNSYGKTWHVWNTGPGADKVPLGEPRLAWSFNRDGEAKPELVEERDKSLGLNTQETREKRRELQSGARPQMGVNALHGKFPGPTQPLEGVTDQQDVAN